MEEIAREQDLSFKLGLIHSDIDREVVRTALKAGKITPLEYVPELTEEALDETDNIVAQIGVEPMIRALEEGVSGYPFGESLRSRLFLRSAHYEGV